MDADQIRDRMDPKHLSETEMKEDVAEQAQVAIEPPPPDPEEDPRSQREYMFDFAWTDAHGKVWKGKFANRVPDIRTRQLIGTFRAQLGNNLPVEALDGMTQEMNLVTAHLAFSLIKRPKWAEDLTTLFDFNLVQALYQEVADHEATFLGYGALAETG